MSKGLKILALLLPLVFGTAGAALAQDTFDSGVPTQSTDPSPVNPTRQVYENGNLMVIVHADKNYGFRIGSQIPLEIDFIAKPGIAINLDNLLLSQFDPVNGSDLDLVAYPSPEVMQPFEQDGMVITRVKFAVRTWTMKPAITFNTQFLYAKEALADGKPNWQKAMTPDFVITRSFTASDISKNLDEGDLTVQNPPPPAPVDPMRSAGYLIALIPALFVLGGVFLWAFPPKEVPAHEKFWKVFNPVRARAAQGGLTMGDAGIAAGQLRTYFGIESLSDGDEIEKALQTFYEGDRKRYEKAKQGRQAFEMLDAMYKRQAQGATVALSASQTKELLAIIDRLVPAE